jgi:hypothetical protein
MEEERSPPPELPSFLFVEPDDKRQCARTLEGNPWQRLSKSKNEAISEGPVGLNIISGNRMLLFRLFSLFCSFLS